jgi:ribosome-binding factor A
MRRQPTFTRAERLEHLLIDEVERLLSYEVRSPLAQLVKVTGGHLSPDLGHLRINYILNDETEPSANLLEVLDRSAAFVGRTLQEGMQLRSRPTIVYHYDRDTLRARRVEQLLQQDKLLHPTPTEDSPAEPAEPKAPE